MGLKTFRSILEKFNAAADGVSTSVVMTKDGVALASASPQENPSSPAYDEDKMSALSASMLLIGRKLMGDFGGGNLDRLLIKGEGGYVLAMHDEDLALAVVARPGASAELIFPQMEAAVRSLRHVACDAAAGVPAQSPGA